MNRRLHSEAASQLVQETIANGLAAATHVPYSPGAQNSSSAVPTQAMPAEASALRRGGNAAERLREVGGTPFSNERNCWSNAATTDTFDSERGSAMRKPTEITPSNDDRARVQLAKDRHGVKLLVFRSGASESAVARVLAGMPVKRATLSVVVRAADELEAERARKLAPKHGGGPL